SPRFEEGARFEEGELLAVVDRVPYRARRDRVFGNLQEARHNLEELENGSRKEEIDQGRARLARAGAPLEEKKAKPQRGMATARSGAGTAQPQGTAAMPALAPPAE